MLPRRGFTLAELLIALGILAILATFTIPKLLQVRQNQQWNSQAKETLSQVAAANQQHKLNGLLQAGTLSRDLTVYMNYVAVDSVSIIDQRNGALSASCVTSPCLRLHQGGLLRPSLCTLGATSDVNTLSFLYDPDGVYSGTLNGPGKSIDILIYYNGRETTIQDPIPGTMACGVAQAPVAGANPDWFSW